MKTPTSVDLAYRIALTLVFAAIFSGDASPPDERPAESMAHLTIKIVRIAAVDGIAPNFEWMQGDHRLTLSPATNHFPWAKYSRLKKQKWPMPRVIQRMSIRAVLTDPQFRAVIHALKSRAGTDVITLPRQLIRATESTAMHFGDRGDNLVFDSLSEAEIREPGPYLQLKLDARLSIKTSGTNDSARMESYRIQSGVSVYPGQTILLTTPNSDPERNPPPDAVILFVTASVPNPPRE
jgi:hypothetical protein